MRPVEAVFFLYSKHILSRQQPLPSNRRQHELLWLSWCEGRLSELFTAVLFTTIEHSHKHTRLWAVLSLQMYYGAWWFRFIRFSLGFCEFFLARAILFILCFWCFWCIFSCLFWAVSTVQVIAWKDSSPKWPCMCRAELDIKRYSLTGYRQQTILCTMFLY